MCTKDPDCFFRLSHFLAAASKTFSISAPLATPIDSSLSYLRTSQASRLSTIDGDFILIDIGHPWVTPATLNLRRGRTTVGHVTRSGPTPGADGSPAGQIDL